LHLSQEDCQKRAIILDACGSGSAEYLELPLHFQGGTAEVNDVDAGGVVSKQKVALGRGAEGHAIAAGARGGADGVGHDLDDGVVGAQVGVEEVPLDLPGEQCPKGGQIVLCAVGRLLMTRGI
jgi:hypothetical protein